MSTPLGADGLPWRPGSALGGGLRHRIRDARVVDPAAVRALDDDVVARGRVRDPGVVDAATVGAGDDEVVRLHGGRGGRAAGLPDDGDRDDERHGQGHGSHGDADAAQVGSPIRGARSGCGHLVLLDAPPAPVRRGPCLSASEAVTVELRAGGSIGQLADAQAVGYLKALSSFGCQLADAAHLQGFGAPMVDSERRPRPIRFRPPVSGGGRRSRYR